MRKIVVVLLMLVGTCFGTGCDPLSAVGLGMWFFSPAVEGYHCPAETGYRCIDTITGPSPFETIVGPGF